MTSQPNPFSESEPTIDCLRIFGAGGFGREVAWLASQCWSDRIQLEFLVDRQEYLADPVNGIPIRLLTEVEPSTASAYVIALGDPNARRKAAAACNGAGLKPLALIHPRAEMSRWVDVGPGSVICAGVIATTNITIGQHVHVNLDCTIGHDAQIGDFTTLSPGVHISGNVLVGSDVFIGTGAVIINGMPNDPLVIGNGAVIAAGACVKDSVPAGALVAGVPAVRKR